MLFAAAALILAPQTPPEAPQAALAASASDPALAQPVLLAVTRSGVRVEAAFEPSRGALEVVTPAGVYSTPTDPVAVVLRSSTRDGWRDPAVPLRSSLLQIEELRADGRLGELMELAVHAKARWNGPEDGLRHIAALQALEHWGSRLRLIPTEVDWEDQTDWLWEQILDEEGPRVHLLTGALIAQLPNYSGTSTVRRLASSDLRKGRDHRRPEVRRAAALAGGKQTDADRLRLIYLLDRSLREGHPAVRDAFGWAASRSWGDVADSYWFMAVTRAKEGERIAAAEQLASHGGDRAVDFLAFALSAHDQRVGRRFELAGKDVQIVRDTKSPSSPMLALAANTGCPSTVPYAITPDDDRFEHTSVIKVTKLPPVVTETLIKALARRTGGGEERTAAAWMDWYRAYSKANP